jgi:hypothetical protein
VAGVALAHSATAVIPATASTAVRKVLHEDEVTIRTSSTRCRGARQLTVEELMERCMRASRRERFAPGRGHNALARVAVAGKENDP